MGLKWEVADFHQPTFRFGKACSRIVFCSEDMSFPVKYNQLKFGIPISGLGSVIKLSCRLSEVRFGSPARGER